jgi:Flp pilus assembly protein TadG
MKTISMSPIWFHLRRRALQLLADCRGVAAIEFAFIVPLMLVMFFGTVEFSSGVAINRKVTLVAKAVSDLTSQTALPVDDTYLQNVFTAGIAILKPYSATPIQATLSEIYVDSNQIATIQWSRAATISSNTATQATLATSARHAGDIVTSTVPPGLLVKQTYLIFSEVGYLYTPVVDYMMRSAPSIPLNDVAYTRPRQLPCVTYNALPAGGCPTP